MMLKTKHALLITDTKWKGHGMISSESLVNYIFETQDWSSMSHSTYMCLLVIPYACWDISLAWLWQILCYSSCMLLCAKISPCLKHNFVDSSTSSGSNNLSAIHTCCSLSLGGKALVRSNFGFSSLQHLILCAVTHCKAMYWPPSITEKKLLWLLLKDALTYEYTNKYLGGILILCPLSKTIVIGSCLF